MKTGNLHNTREGWLRSATNELRPYFDKLGYTLPEKIRFAIAFTSGGKRGRIAGECWHPSASADGHYEIFIRADVDDPIEVLGILIHELVHALLPPEAKHGKQYKAIATRIGLEGKMRYALPGPVLKDRVHALAASLGPLPHARLNFTKSADTKKKQTTRYLKAECGAACGYTIRITSKWARAGLPSCPIDKKHGLLVCDMPEESEETEDQSDIKDE